MRIYFVTGARLLLMIFLAMCAWPLPTQVLNDDKRDVRREAARTRNSWFTIGDDAK